MLAACIGLVVAIVVARRRETLDTPSPEIPASPPASPPPVLDMRPILNGGDASVGAAIAGGRDAAEWRYPYICYIRFSRRGCTGILVAPDVVLTAKHCFVDAGNDGWSFYVPPNQHRIVVWIGGSAPQQGEQRDVDYIKVGNGGLDAGRHADLQNDWVFLKLRTPSTKQPIGRIDGAVYTDSRKWAAAGAWPGIFGIGKWVWAIGFGNVPAAQKTEGDYATHLQETPLAISTMDSDFIRIRKTQPHVAGFPDNRTPCGGDSGGPLILRGRSAAEDVLVGMDLRASSVNTCQTTNSSGNAAGATWIRTVSIARASRTGQYTVWSAVTGDKLGGWDCPAGYGWGWGNHSGQCCVRNAACVGAQRSWGFGW